MEKRELSKIVFAFLLTCTICLFTACAIVDDEDLKQNSELYGLWELDSNCRIKIEGDKATFVLLDAEALHKGLSEFLKVGDVAIKNLKKTEENKWKGQEIVWYYKSTGEVSRVDYLSFTYTLNSGKDQLTREKNDIVNTEAVYYKVTQ